MVVMNTLDEIIAALDRRSGRRRRECGMVVMNTLDEIIAALDDDDENVAEMIVEQGRTHARFSDDFDEQTFWVKKRSL